jgi:energy-coupling factor transporter ATP-binding protein EcfA2
MNFWFMNVSPITKYGENKEEVIEILTVKKNIGFVGGWGENNIQPKTFSDKMEIDDVVLFKTEGLLALVKVIGHCIKNGENNPLFELTRKIEIISLEGDSYVKLYWAQFNENWSSNIFLRPMISKANDSAFIKFWYQTEKNKQMLDTCLKLLHYKNQLILQGPPGSGKTRQAKLIAEALTKTSTDLSPENRMKQKGIGSQGEFKIIQFHPLYPYQIKLRGVVAETTECENVVVKPENNIFIDFARKATENPCNNYVLIIDEINSAKLSSVLGELIYAMEYRCENVTSIYANNGEQEFSLTPNLYIIGTMNTADLSVGHIDYVVRRRFAFVDIVTDESIIDNTTAKKNV